MVEENFKLVSTVIYYIFMKVMGKITTGYARAKDTKGNEVYGKKLIPYDKIKIFFSPKFLSKDKNKEQKAFVE